MTLVEQVRGLILTILLTLVLCAQHAWRFIARKYRAWKWKRLARRVGRRMERIGQGVMTDYVDGFEPDAEAILLALPHPILTWRQIRQVPPGGDGGGGMSEKKGTFKIGRMSPCFDLSRQTLDTMKKRPRFRTDGTLIDDPREYMVALALGVLTTDIGHALMDLAARGETEIVFAGKLTIKEETENLDHVMKVFLEIEEKQEVAP